MEPSDRIYVVVYLWFRKLGQLCGLDIFADIFKVAPQGYILILALYVFFFSCVWTIYTYPFDEKLMCITFFAFACQGIVKFHCFLKYHKEIRDKADFTISVYRANTRSSPNKTLLKKSVNVTAFIFKAGLSLLVATAILTLLRPLISYLLIGKLEPIVPAYFPGLDIKRITDYACLAGYHAYILFLFVIGTGAIDLALMALVVQSYTMSQIFRNAVGEFNSLVEKEKLNTITRDIHQSLRNLILMHTDFVDFTRTMKSEYNEICLIQITMANTIMIVLVYVTLLVDWFPAYFLMATAFFQVFEFSVLGTIVEIANDKIYSAICDISVTGLPIAEQQKVLFMILTAQNPHLLTIGGFQPLNVETFVEAVKRTYTVGMLIINMQIQ